GDDVALPDARAQGLHGEERGSGVLRGQRVADGGGPLGEEPQEERAVRVGLGGRGLGRAADAPGVDAQAHDSTSARALVGRARRTFAPEGARLRSALSTALASASRATAAKAGPLPETPAAKAPAARLARVHAGSTP